MSKKRPIERRVLDASAAGVELRVEGAETGRLVGHAAVFGQWTTISDPLWGGLWEESVAPGAFKKTLGEADVRALFNHDPNIVLGRNKAGTLELSEDATGLLATITPPDNEWGRPVREAIQRGDVSGMSIAFQVVRDEWERPDRRKNPGALRRRTIKEMRLFDVSPVTYPAFPQTDIATRAADLGCDGGNLQEAFRAAQLAQLGMPLEAEERAAVRAAMDVLQRIAAAETEPDAGDGQPSDPAHHSDTTTEPDARRAGHSIAELRRELVMHRMRLQLSGG